MSSDVTGTNDGEEDEDEDEDEEVDNAEEMG